MAIVYTFCSQKDIVDIERSYEAAMIREIEAIVAALPHRDLCIQWDVCIEMLMWDGRLRSRYPADGASDEEIVARMKRLSAAVPDDVDLGFHLCYGDLDGKHWVDPLDMAKMVGLANAIRRAVPHPIGYVHMPVPLARDDDAYFQPLRDLDLAPETEIYLGIVHAADGAAGAAKRIAAARRYLPAFGIATECGMARARTPETVTRLLEIHAQSSREPAP
jgi:methionine synthase II (cobalamin-independent)